MTTGSVPATIEEMADHAYEFIQTLGYNRADLLAFPWAVSLSKT